MAKPEKTITNSNILILLQASQKLGINFQILDWQKYKIKFSYQNLNHIIASKSLGLNSSSAIAFSRNKNQVLLKLKQAGLPVLPQKIIKSPKDYLKIKAIIPFPQVIKPLYGQKGRHVYLNLKNSVEAQSALKQVLKNNPPAVIEPYFKAHDYRFLVLKQKLIGLCQRIPPTIIADGQHNLEQLIKLENQKRLDYNQKKGKRLLNRLLVWTRIKWYLNQQGLKLTDIPPKKQKITVYPLTNFSTGGQVKTINPSTIHSSYKKIALKAVKQTGLTIAGLDMLIKNIKKPAKPQNCAVLEINSDPGLRLHDWPNQGKSQKTAEQILKFIFSLA